MRMGLKHESQNGAMAAGKRLQFMDRRGRVTIPWYWRQALHMMGKTPITLQMEENGILIRKAYVLDGSEDSFVALAMPDMVKFIRVASPQQLKELTEAIEHCRNK